MAYGCSSLYVNFLLSSAYKPSQISNQSQQHLISTSNPFYADMASPERVFLRTPRTAPSRDCSTAALRRNVYKKCLLPFSGWQSRLWMQALQVCRLRYREVVRRTSSTTQAIVLPGPSRDGTYQAALHLPKSSWQRPSRSFRTYTIAMPTALSTPRQYRDSSAHE